MELYLDVTKTMAIPWRVWISVVYLWRYQQDGSFAHDTSRTDLLLTSPVQYRKDVPRVWTRSDRRRFGFQTS